MTLLGAALSISSAERTPKCYSKDVNAWFCRDYVVDRKDDIISATLTHLTTSLAAVALGLAIAFPLALLARRYPKAESSVLGVSTAIYTIPSLALLPLLVPITGLTATTVIIGLGLYCLTILVRAFLDGLRSVPDDVRESAVGLGYDTRKLLFGVELPIAMPVIMAGLRVAMVSTIALTTIGTVVSEGGLGTFIAHGTQYSFHAELLTGAVLCVVLALVMDVLIVLFQRAMTPWTRGVTS